MNKEKIEQEFDDSETYSLRTTIAKFIAPRLKRYQELANKKLNRDVELVNKIDDFIHAMELVANEDENDCFWDEKLHKEVMKGLKAFPEIFGSLWWF